ncbi:hypothetical protein BaRGS_00017408 [Batillaria attramentaria]|uniref:Uncharacterized protein n=1 Tax=Batillaria attramentaria TaxID=370345 RepID=A0ABD0KX30_9CAEN
MRRKNIHVFISNRVEKRTIYQVGCSHFQLRRRPLPPVHLGTGCVDHDKRQLTLPDVERRLSHLKRQRDHKPRQLPQRNDGIGDLK